MTDPVDPHADRDQCLRCSIKHIGNARNAVARLLSSTENELINRGTTAMGVIALTKATVQIVHTLSPELRKAILALVEAILTGEESQLGYPRHFWLALAHMNQAEAECIRNHPDLAHQIRALRKRFEESGQINLESIERLLDNAVQYDTFTQGE